MYTNKCIKCGKEFETKNPKRVICPDCLYPDKAQAGPSENKLAQATETLRSYSFGNDNPQPQQQRYNKRSYNNQGGNYQRNDNWNRNYLGNNYQRNNDGHRRSFNNNRPHQSGFNNGGFNK